MLFILGILVLGFIGIWGVAYLLEAIGEAIDDPKTDWIGVGGWLLVLALVEFALMGPYSPFLR